MKKRIFMITGFILLLGLVAADVFGQSGQRPNPRQLGESISSGDVTLMANGNGGCSGPAVVGRLRNNTSNEIRINVTINGGLYLNNSGSGQNMLAIQIFRSDGVYYGSGTNRHIRLPASAETQITIYAFCANFERNSPSVTESFSTGSMPQDIQVIASKISRYMADHFADDPTDAIQVALWRSQGISRTDIAKSFEFGDADWELSSRIMGY